MKEAIKGYITSMVNSYINRAAKLENDMRISNKIKGFVEDLNDLLDYVEDIPEVNEPITVNISNNVQNEKLLKRIKELEESCNTFSEVENNLQKKIKELISIEEVSSSKVDEIIETRKPKGLFFHCKSFCWLGIDNVTGDAWTKEFTTKEDCINWLLGGNK